MRSILAAVLVMTAFLPVRGGAAVVLQDGQVLEGVEVRRLGEDVLLTVDGGNVITVPASIVKEIRLSGGGPGEKKPAPTAFREKGPETITGEKVEPPKRSRQLANAGAASRFPRDVVSPQWSPRTDWDTDPSNNDFAPSTWSRGPIDPTWTPDSAFDGRVDVLAGGRSTWFASILDPAWKPADGFVRGEGPLRARPTSPAPPPPPSAAARAPEPPPLTPADDPTLCAASLASAKERPRVARIADERYAALPFPLWEAHAGSGDTARRFVFTVIQNTCRVLGGDWESAPDEPVSRGLQVSRGVIELDAALAASPRPRLESPRDIVALAFAAASVTDPDVSGSLRAEFRLLDSAADLGALAKGTSSCTESARVRKKALDRALGRFAKPSVDQGPAGTVVRFLAWSSSGGEVAAYEVYVSGEGRVAVKRELTSAHLGGHLDRAPASTTAGR